MGDDQSTSPGPKAKCACVDGDARHCLAKRSPMLHRMASEPELYPEFSVDGMTSQCECPCHDEIEAERRELYPEPWEVRP